MWATSVRATLLKVASIERRRSFWPPFLIVTLRMRIMDICVILRFVRML